MEDPVRLGLTEESRESRLRGFGTGLSVVLAVFGALAWRRHAPSAPWYGGGAVLSLALARLAPAAFGPVYGPWMKAAGVLAELNGWLITALIYWLAVVPYAYVLRLAGRDPLAREGGAPGTDWLKREKAADFRGYESTF